MFVIAKFIKYIFQNKKLEKKVKLYIIQVYYNFLK